VPSAEAARRELMVWAAAGDEKPLDRLDDTNFRMAVASLQQAEAQDDLPTLAPAEVEPEPVQLTDTPWLFWLAGGFVALWVLLTMVVMVLLLLK
jgi:hypothetical protein